LPFPSSSPASLVAAAIAHIDTNPVAVALVAIAARHPCCHCPHCCCSPPILIAIAIAHDAIAIAFFVTRHPNHRYHCPLCRQRCCLPDTHVNIAIALFIALAVHSPAILVANAITFLP
jgi:hypothetical protein